jgi:hypothetical protein
VANINCLKRLIQVKDITGEILFIVSNLKAETLSAADLQLPCWQGWGTEQLPTDIPPLEG